MDIGINNYYWGLDKNIRLPTPAGYIDRKICAVDTTFGPPCIFGVKSSIGSIFLIGDSHASELSQLVKQVGLSRGFQVAIGTHSGYGLVLQSSSGNTHPSEDLAYQNAQSTFKWIRTHRPDTVVISENYVYWNKAEMLNAILNIKKIVKRVVLVNQTPIFTDSAYMKFLSLLDKPYVPKTKVNIKEIDDRSIEYNSYLKYWAKVNGIQVIDPWNAFCGESSCFRYANGHWLFADLNHLTIYGAERLRPEFERILWNVQ